MNVLSNVDSSENEQIKPEQQTTVTFYKFKCLVIENQSIWNHYASNQMHALITCCSKHELLTKNLYVLLMIETNGPSNKLLKELVLF